MGTSLVPPFGGPECYADITLIVFGPLSEGDPLLVVIPALRSCISSGLGGPTRSWQREARAESFPHFSVGKCLFPGKFRYSLSFVELNEDSWQKQRVESYFNFVSLHYRETGFFWIYENTHTHTHTHTCMHIFSLRKDISSEIYMLCCILSEVERQFSECSVAAPGLQA